MQHTFPPRGSGLFRLVADGGFVEAGRAGSVVYEVVLAEIGGAAGRPFPGVKRCRGQDCVVERALHIAKVDMDLAAHDYNTGALVLVGRVREWSRSQTHRIARIWCGNLAPFQERGRPARLSQGRGRAG